MAKQYNLAHGLLQTAKVRSRHVQLLAALSCFTTTQYSQTWVCTTKFENFPQKFGQTVVTVPLRIMINK